MLRVQPPWTWWGPELTCVLKSHSTRLSSAWGPGPACASLGSCVDSLVLCFTLHLLLQIASCPSILEHGFLRKPG